MILMGKLSSPNKISTVYSAAGTIVFWIVFLIVMLFIKPVEKPKKYNEVKIVLDSAPIKQEIASKTAEASAVMAAKSAASSESSDSERSEVKSSEVLESAPAPIIKQEKSAEKPQVKTQEKNQAKNQNINQPSKTETSTPKTETAKKTSVPAPVEPVYAKSVDDALDFDSVKKTSSQQQFNWDMFDSDEPGIENVSSGKTVQTKNSMTGTSGTSAESPNGPVTSEVQGKGEGKKTVSEGTKQNLSTIGNASYVGNVGTVLGAAEGEAEGFDDYLFDGKNFKGSSGRTRGLLTPAVINITEHADQITNNETVEIRFVVLSVGTIDKTSIEITPPVLTRAVKDEIISQLMKWQFSPDSEDAVAVFSLNIVKK